MLVGKKEDVVYISVFMDQERKSILLIILACLIWAIDLIVRYPLTQNISYIHLTFIESALGLFLILPYLIKHGIQDFKSFNRKDWILSAFLGGIGMTGAGFLSSVSLLKSSPGVFSMVQMLQPFFVVYAARLFLKEKIDSLYFYWGAWVILSAILMYSQDIELFFNSKLSVDPSGLLIAFLTMLIWGSCTIAAKFILIKHSPMTLITARWGFAFVFSLIFLLFDGNSLKLDYLLNVDSFLRLFFMSGFAGCFSMYIYYSGMRGLPAAKISFLELCYPAFGIMLWAFSMFEHVAFLQAVGIASFFSFIMIIFSQFNSRSKS
jgi:drug/metabolite transporter (DMT)-like permease